MNNKYLIKRALGDGLGTAAYIFLVSQIMNHAERLFGKIDDKVLAPMVFLLLFVFSALFTGYLVLGKPIMMYLDGQKKEAVRLLYYTGACLFVLMLIGFLIIIVGK